MPKTTQQTPSVMPPIVADTTEDLLRRLEAAMDRHAPQTLASLQPGLEPAEIDRLQLEAGIVLDESLRELYLWRNGQRLDGPFEVMFGEWTFYPLEDALREWRRETLAIEKHRNSWLGRLLRRISGDERPPVRRAVVYVFNNGCGDHICYRPETAPQEGPFVRMMHESQTDFPSLNNLLAAVVDAYENGVFHETLVEGRLELVEDESSGLESLLELYGRYDGLF